MNDTKALRAKLHGCLTPSKDGQNGTLTVTDTPALTAEEILYLLGLIPEESPFEAMKAAGVRLRAAERKVFGVPRNPEVDQRLRDTMKVIDDMTGGGIR